MSAPPVQAWWATAPLSGAIGVLHLHGELEPCLDRLTGTMVPVGGCRLVDLAGVDRGLVIRPSETGAMLMPHGGPQIRRLLTRAASEAGATLSECQDVPLRARWPEASDLVEACMLDALSRTGSPRAVQILLRQPDLHRKALAGGWIPDASDLEHARSLRGLITPPMVAVVGAPNVGKSSLLNRLAGREVAITADHEGTTRDAVTARVELDGVACTLVDLPGQRASDDPIEQRAIELGRRFLADADLVLAVVEPERPDPPKLERTPDLVVINKCDTGSTDRERRVSVHTGAGIDSLVRELRERLVPDAALEKVDRPWCFHPALIETLPDERRESDRGPGQSPTIE